MGDEHFEKWCVAHKQYLDRLWGIFTRNIQQEMYLATQCTQDDFIEFVYSKSDGYISDYL